MLELLSSHLIRTWIAAWCTWTARSWDIGRQDITDSIYESAASSCKLSVAAPKGLILTHSVAVRDMHASNFECRLGSTLPADELKLSVCICLRCLNGNLRLRVHSVRHMCLSARLQAPSVFLSARFVASNDLLCWQTRKPQPAQAAGEGPHSSYGCGRGRCSVCLMLAA